MNLRTAKKINKNPSRYKGYQILKAETIVGRRARKQAKKNS